MKPIQGAKGSTVTTASACSLETDTVEQTTTNPAKAVNNEYLDANMVFSFSNGETIW
jgi:hypothetical protein